MLCSCLLKHWTRRVALVRDYNANRCAITRIKQKEYTKTYPTLLVYLDGSTTTIRFHEPRKIIKLPIIYENLNEIERAAFLARRRLQEKVEIKTDSTKVKFDGSKYLKYVKKNKINK